MLPDLKRRRLVRIISNMLSRELLQVRMDDKVFHCWFLGCLIINKLFFVLMEFLHQNLQ